MMKNFFYSLLILILTPLMSWAQSPFPDQYCGEQIVMSQGQQFSSDVCVSGKKSRLVMTVEGKSTIVIVRPDKKSVYNLDPVTRLVMISPIRPEDEQLIESYDKNSQRELIGAEVLAGIDHDKYKMKAGNQEIFVWVNKQNGFPEQIESVDKSFHINWKNIKLETPPSDLFEIPAGYKTVNTSEAVRVEKP